MISLFKTVFQAAAVSLQALEDENAEAVRGEYSHNYNTFHLIGNGAFGSVKLAARKDSGLLVSIALEYLYHFSLLVCDFISFSYNFLHFTLNSSCSLF